MQKKKVVLTIIFIIIILLVIFFAYKMFRIINDNKKTNDEIERIKGEVIIKPVEPEEEPTTSEEDTEYKLPMDFAKLKEINSDTVAWIKVDNTNIDYPIVKANDNVYYLDHSFYRESNVNGWIFENSNNDSYFTDDNTTIFGHNTNGYTMFSELRDIYNGNLGNTIYITIYLEDKVLTYQVFSIYLENPNNTSNISKYLNQSIIDNMINKSKLNTGVGVVEGDKIITLSTCNNITSDRLVLHAKKI